MLCSRPFHSLGSLCSLGWCPLCRPHLDCPRSNTRPPGHPGGGLHPFALRPSGNADLGMLQASQNSGCPRRLLCLVITPLQIPVKGQSRDPARLVLECRLPPCPFTHGGWQVQHSGLDFTVKCSCRMLKTFLYEKVSALQETAPDPSLGYPQPH